MDLSTNKGVREALRKIALGHCYYCNDKLTYELSYINERGEWFVYYCKNCDKTIHSKIKRR